MNNCVNNYYKCKITNKCEDSIKCEADSNVKFGSCDCKHKVNCHIYRQNFHCDDENNNCEVFKIFEEER